MMKITVLDGYTLNPGDLNWAPFRKLGNLTVYDRTAEHLVVERARDAAILLTNKTPLPSSVLKQLPALRYIGVLATGYNVVDVSYANDHGIIVTNVPGYGTDAVVQLTFALLLELTSHVQRHSDSVHAGDWAASPDFCYWNYPLVELAGKTMGIIGFGTIGQQVADVAAAFGMRVIAASRRQTDQSHRKAFRWAGTEELFAESDVVSLHCPLFPETRGLINRQSLRRMKNTAFLLNTSRGPLIVEEELAEALNTGTIAGAGLDVLTIEPPSAKNPLYHARNCIITPHIAWATREARSRLMHLAESNVSSFLAGNPKNVVHPF